MTSKHGLCVRCIHQQLIPSPKEIVYTLCRLALSDKAFRKYPVLPVLRCAGFQPAAEDPLPRL